MYLCTCYHTDVDETINYVVNHGIKTVSQKQVKGIDIAAEENELLSGHRHFTCNNQKCCIPQMFCSW